MAGEPKRTLLFPPPGVGELSEGNVWRLPRARMPCLWARRQKSEIDGSETQRMAIGGSRVVKTAGLTNSQVGSVEPSLPFTNRTKYTNLAIEMATTP